MRKIRVVVVGGGPGGYTAGIRLAQLGQEVLVVESDRLGGVCLNRGCIPTKALSYAVEILETPKKARRLGIELGQPKLDLNRLRGWKDGVVDRLVKGVEALFRANRVESISGRARLAGANRVLIETQDGELEIEAESVVIATGTHASGLPGVDLSDPRVWTTDDALNLPELPSELLVVGAGPSGLELATIYRGLGSRVRVVELMDQVLPGTDRELAAALKRSLLRSGIEVMLSTRVKGLGPEGLVVEEGGRERVLQASRVLLAVGRRPNTQDLGLEMVGLLPGGYIEVDERMATSAPGVFAIGDVTGPPLLAHRAMHQGMVVAEVIAGRPRVWDVRAIPNCVFTQPPLATVGLAEEEARAQGYKVSVGRFPFVASGRAQTMLAYEGLVKVVGEATTGRLLGVHILGPEAPSLVGEAVLGVELGVKVEDLCRLVHPHPTLTEAIQEAAENFYHRAIHIPNRPS